MAGRAIGNTKQINRSDRQQPERLKQHPGLRIHGDLFTQQAVKSEAERQAQRDNRQRAEGPELYQHAAGGQQHRQPLHPAKALPEEDHPQQNIHQRIDKIAQAGFQHMMVIHRPDKQQPVAAHQHRRERQQEHLFRRFQQPFDLRPLTADADQRDHEKEGPDHAVSQNFIGGNIVDKLEVRRRDTPDKIGGQGQKNPHPRLFSVHRYKSIAKERDVTRFRPINPPYTSPWRWRYTPALRYAARRGPPPLYYRRAAGCW